MTVANKIIYGNNTLIDLTSDTATASDVRTGVIFHLASGVQTTGIMTTQMSDKSATTTGTTTQDVSISGLDKEPSWFILICASTTTVSRTRRVMHIIYDGSSITERHSTNTTNSGYIDTTDSSFAPTFTYSSGTLNITTTKYFAAADWELYYM